MLAKEETDDAAWIAFQFRHSVHHCTVLATKCIFHIFVLQRSWRKWHPDKQPTAEHVDGSSDSDAQFAPQSTT